MALVARGILFSVLGMLVWALLPIALAWTPTTVMTGSMEPRIHPGDVVVSRPAPADAAALNHILLVDDPDHAGRLRLHRFAEFAPDGNLILRGDANSANDSTPVAPAAVHGVAVLRIPFAGLPMVWFAEKNWGPFVATLAAVAGLTLAAASGSSTATSRRDPENPGGTPGPRRQPRTLPVIHGGRRLLAGRTRASQAFLAVAMIGLVLCPGMLMSAPAHAGFSAFAPTDTSTFSAVSSYPCQPPTPEYDPYLLYSFDEGSDTTVTDNSGHARNGALQGKATRVAGPCGATAHALVLNDSPGPIGFVSTSNSTDGAVAAPNIFTVEIWFKTETKTGGKLIGFGNAKTGLSSLVDRHLYMTNSGTIAFGAAPGKKNDNSNEAADITSPASYNDGFWHQAIATMSGAGIILYIDGAKAASDSTVLKGDSYSGYWRIGYDAMDIKKVTWTDAPTSLFFSGTVDNAAVYHTALSEEQIKAKYLAVKADYGR